MALNTNVKSTIYASFFAQSLVIWLTIFALSPAFATRPSKCELIADATKWLKPGEMHVTTIKDLPPQYKLTGHALGYGHSLILAALKYDPKTLGFQSERLIARPFKPTDSQVDILYEFEDPQFEYLFTPNRNGYVWRDGLRRMSDGAWMPAIVVGEVSMGLSYHFGGAIQESLILEDKATGKPAGFITISLAQNSDIYDLSYGIFEKFRSKGYATEAIKAAAEYLLARRDNFLISAGVRADNPSSKKALESAGFIQTKIPGAPESLIFYTNPESARRLVNSMQRNAL